MGLSPEKVYLMDCAEAVVCAEGNTVDDNMASLP